MNLKEYFSAKGIKIVAFANRCGITYRTLWKYLKGGDIMLSTAKKIVEQTEGGVTLDDLAYRNENE